MKVAILLSLLMLFFSACSTTPGLSARIWNTRDVIHKTIVLDDPVIDERFSFDNHSIVAVDYGKKGKWVSSPLMKWKITGQRLQIFDSGRIFQNLFLISKDKDGFHVKDKSGKNVYFRFIQA